MTVAIQMRSRWSQRSKRNSKDPRLRLKNGCDHAPLPSATAVFYTWLTHLGARLKDWLTWGCPFLHRRGRSAVDMLVTRDRIRGAKLLQSRSWFQSATSREHAGNGKLGDREILNVTLRDDTAMIG